MASAAWRLLLQGALTLHIAWGEHLGGFPPPRTPVWGKWSQARLLQRWPFPVEFLQAWIRLGSRAGFKTWNVCKHRCAGWVSLTFCSALSQCCISLVVIPPPPFKKKKKAFHFRCSISGALGKGLTFSEQVLS